VTGTRAPRDGSAPRTGPDVVVELPHLRAVLDAPVYRPTEVRRFQIGTWQILGRKLGLLVWEKSVADTANTNVPIVALVFEATTSFDGVR